MSIFQNSTEAADSLSMTEIDQLQITHHKGSPTGGELWERVSHCAKPNYINNKQSTIYEEERHEKKTFHSLDRWHYHCVGNNNRSILPGNQKGGLLLPFQPPCHSGRNGLLV